MNAKLFTYRTSDTNTLQYIHVTLAHTNRYIINTNKL